MHEMRKTALWAVPCILFAGCAGAPWSSKADTRAMKPTPPPQLCNAAPARWAVGKTNTGQHIEEARRRSGALMARVLRPEQKISGEANPERLNLHLDATGRIASVTCG